MALGVGYLAVHPPLDRIAAGITATAMALLVPLHMVGWWERSQPIFETIEGFVFLGLAIGFAVLAAQP